MSVTRWRGVVVVLAAVAAPAAAQSQAELDQQIKNAEQMPQRMEDAVREAIRQVADIDREQAALLKRLGEANDRARQEKERADALADQLAKLTGAPPQTVGAIASTGAAAPPAAPAMLTATEQTVVIPERRVNGLGVVEDAATPLADVAPECDAVRFTPWSELETSPGGLRVEHTGGRVTFLHDDGMGAGVPLAIMQLDAGKLTWTWSDRVVGGARPTLATLDRWLATGVIEATAGGAVAARWQVAPAVIAVKLPKPGDAEQRKVAGPAWAADLPLGLAAVQPVRGWVAEAGVQQRLRLMSDEAVLTLTWDPRGAALAVDLRPMAGGTAAWLDEQIKQWEKDAEAERAKDTPDERELARMENERQRLLDTKAAVAAAAPATTATPGERHDCVIRLTTPDGVTCVRFELEPE